jgi:putative two-component system response regulator
MENEKIAVPKILIIDDVDTNRFVLKDIISSMGYQPILTENGEQALKIVERYQLALVISDIAMPVMDGYEFCRRMKENPNTREIPIIFISAFDEPSDVVKGFNIGGADYITKPFIPEVVRARVGLHLKLSEDAQKMQELNRNLQVSVTEQLRQVEREKRNVLYAVIRVGRENAAYDEDHMDRMSKNCRLLAEAMQLSPRYDTVISDSYIDTIELAAPLCDIGNVAIPTDILQKRAPLTEEERRKVETHTVIGSRILADIEDKGDDNSFIRMSKDIAHYHHENWDGSGYPEGRKGDDIPLSAQIVAVAGAYCSITEQRTYRGAYGDDEAMHLMERDSGVKFNPEIFQIFRKIQRQLF